jgi:hypothetical protein
MVLVSDQATARLLPEADGQQGSAPGDIQQGVSDGDAIASRDLELMKVERSFSSGAVLEEQLPGLPVRLPASPLDGWWHVEHHDVIGVMREDPVHVHITDGLRPAFNHGSYLGLARMTSHSSLPSCMFGERFPFDRLSHIEPSCLAARRHLSLLRSVSSRHPSLRPATEFHLQVGRAINYPDRSRGRRRTSS